MPESRHSRLRGTLLLTAVAGSLSVASPAFAHKLNVFAYAEGSTIRGEVYARDGEVIRQAVVAAYGPAGEKLGEATADSEGTFALDARFRCDHRIVADAGGGHQAEFTLLAEELPDSLPGRPGEVEPAPARTGTGEPPQLPVSSASPADQEQILAQLAALERQIVQLRKQLDGYEAKVRWHDVLGGLGYILGLMGLAHYFLGRKRKEGRGQTEG